MIRLSTVHEVIVGKRYLFEAYGTERVNLRYDHY